MGRRLAPWLFARVQGLDSRQLAGNGDQESRAVVGARVHTFYENDLLALLARDVALQPGVKRRAM